MNGTDFRPPLIARLMQRLLARLKCIGLRIEPFLTVREDVPVVADLPADDAIEFGFVGREQIDELLRLEAKPEREELEQWFAAGKLCFAARENGRLLAKMWCDLEEYSFEPNRRALAPDEAYLFAAYADPQCRGRNLAPRMRMACHAALRELGRQRFLSYTDYFNTSARRFKQKLGAREQELRVHIRLFDRWSHTVTLRRYDNRA